MAGDLSLRPVSPAFPLEAQVDTKQKRDEPQYQKLSDSSFEKADTSEERRAALEKAIVSERKEPSGRLIIERDQETGKYVQKVIDPKSGKVLKQWPEEKFLELARQMGEAYGLLVDRNI